MTLDTFRADRVGPATPSLRRFLDSAIVFPNAFSVAPLTLPAHASLMSGRLPFEHGARDNGGRIATSTEVAAVALAKRGYHTAAFVASDELDRATGIDRGFAEFVEGFQTETGECSAAAVTTFGLAFLQARRASAGPFFLWLHYYDAHFPYLAPGATDGSSATDYDREVSYLDGELGKVLDVLAAAPLGGRTIVVVAGDHGEGLGEHGERTHGFLLHDATLRVPLAMRVPGEPARTVATPGTLADVMATVARWVGPLPRGPQARDLLAPAEPRTLYAETLHPSIKFGWPAFVAVRHPKGKAVQGVQQAWFDLSADPREEHSPRGPMPAILAQALRDAVTASGARPEPERNDARAELASLGYVNPGTTAAAPSDSAAYQRAMVEAEGLILDTLLAREWVHRGELARARPLLDRVLKARPGFVEARYWRGVERMRGGNLRGAEEDLRQALAARPGEVMAQYQLAVVLLRKNGGGAEAGRLFSSALAKNEGWVEARFGLASALHVQGKLAEAMREYERVLAAQPQHRFAREAIADLRRRMGRGAGQ